MTSINAVVSSPKSVVMEVEGVSYGLRSVSSSWSINEIPVCTCTLPVGRAFDTKENAPVHSTLANLKSGARAIVRAEFGGETSPGKKWAAGSHVLFDGYIRGVQTRKKDDRLDVTVQLEHWLSRLAFASIFSELLSPLTPGNFAYPSSSPLDLLTTQPSTIAGTSLANVLLDGIRASQGDFNAGIQELLNTFSTSAGSRETALAERLFGDISLADSNALASQALDRIEGPSQYVYGKPLTLDYQSTPTLEESLVRGITKGSMSSLSGGTLWSFLIGRVCSQFALALYPAVDRAVLAPHYPVRNDENYWKVIDASEVSSVGFSSPVNRPLRAVSCDVTAGLQTFDVPASASPSDQVPLAGLYIPEPAPENGMVLVVPPPPWMSEVQVQDLSRDAWSGNNQSVTLSVAPDEGSAASERVPQVKTDVDEMASRYCRSIYDTQNLAGSTMMFNTKFRLDLAPGSYVQVRPYLQGAGNGDNLNVPLVGTVNRVTCELNQESSTAMTVVMLSHVHGPSYTPAGSGHGIFGQQYIKGLPLVDAFENQ